jgi:uracil-DNA glycosylase family 4
LADSRRRYLAQQAELGSDEVVLDVSLNELWARSKSQARAPESPSMVREPAVVPGETARPPARPPARPSPSGSSVPIDDTLWRKNAPPIPGNGLLIESPPVLTQPPTLVALDSLAAVAAVIATCRQCLLCEGRKKTVPGEGDPAARLMFVGEGPGATEDETGRPFVGAAGDLLTKMIGSIGLAREAVYIANIVKCRPPQNRKPLPEEAAACLPYLHRQIALIQPKVLVALGGTAAESLLGVKQALGALRGRVHHYDEIPLVVTYHPAALLRNPNWKKPTWDDIRIARQLLDR